MPSTYSANLALEKQATGENENTWGTNLNTVIENIDTAIAGYLSKSVAGSSNVTLTAAEALNAVLNLTGALTGNIAVIVPTAEKTYWVANATSGSYTLTVRTSGGTGPIIPQGTRALVYCDGTNVVLLTRSLFDADGDTGIEVEQSADEDKVRIKTGATERGYWDSTGLTLVSTDAGAAAGPTLVLDRDSASPAASDVIGRFTFRGEDSAGNDDDYAYVEGFINDPTSTSEDASLDFYTLLAGAATRGMRLTGTKLFVGATANAQMTQGVTINQGANDDEILALKSSDVAHGRTSITETDTYGFFRKLNAADGGLEIVGIDDAGGTHDALRLSGFANGVSTSAASGSVAPVMVYAATTSGTDMANISANGMCFAVVGRTGGAWAAKFFVDIEGDIFIDGTGPTAFDTHDDASLARAFDLVRDPLAKSVVRGEFDRFVDSNIEALQRAGILSTPSPDEGRPFVNVAQLQRLHNGAIWQQHVRTLELVAAIEEELPGFTARYAERLRAAKVPTLALGVAA